MPTPITHCFTVPASWSNKAKNETRVSAYQAGFANHPGDILRLITEPEAAIIATINSLIEIKGRNPIEDNTCGACCLFSLSLIHAKTYAVMLADLGVALSTMSPTTACTMEQHLS